MQIDNHNTDVHHHTLIVAFGPPASGKTTFAEALQSSYKQHHHGNEESCLILSADCLQEYLRNHSLKSLNALIDAPKQFKQLNQYKLDRSNFIQNNWKQSRMFIKNNLKAILAKWKVVILQDDLLLKSQRKQMRQIAEALKVQYIEILISSSLEQCLHNWKKRQQLTQNKCSNDSIVKQCYQKLQIDENPYSIAIQQPYIKSNLWMEISAQVKQVIILHPQLVDKPMQSEQNMEKDRVQIQIRKYISEIMKNKELKLKLFGQISSNKVSALMSSIKKRYHEKNKSLKGFINFLFLETGQISQL